MELGENSTAFRRVKTVRWAKYPYSVIVVPGSRNDWPGVNLSPAGRLRDELAAKRFRVGKAPFLIVSGGFVHAIRTEFSGAIEIKHDLMTRFGIPADSIIFDPHAPTQLSDQRKGHATVLSAIRLRHFQKHFRCTATSRQKDLNEAATRLETIRIYFDRAV